YYLLHDLRFKNPEQHAIDAAEPEDSTMNAPIRKFRWLNVPGLDHQGLDPKFGRYTYTVTHRYFDDNQRLAAFEPGLSVD
ncbi:hypothetical protein ACC758_39560, partial [Rhizobium ruizarguesonis]